MYISHQKEQYSIAFVKALAAKVGFNPSRLEVDNDSIDLYLSAKDFSDEVRNPQIHLQLKCTSKNEIKNEFIHFSLNKKNYDDLRAPNVLCPRYLVVVTVPEDIDRWIEQDSNKLILKHCSYWLSIKDYPESENKTRVTVKIPVKNMLTEDSLYDLMEKACKGETL